MSLRKEDILILMLDDVEQRKALILEYIQDKTNSYEDRLEDWRRTPKHLREIGQYIPSLEKFEEKYPSFSFFDDFYLDKHEAYDVVDNYDYLRTDHGFFHEEPENVLNEAKFKLFIEDLMDEGIHGFHNDW